MRGDSLNIQNFSLVLLRGGKKEIPIYFMKCPKDLNKSQFGTFLLPPKTLCEGNTNGQITAAPPAQKNPKVL